MSREMDDDQIIFLMDSNSSSTNDPERYQIGQIKEVQMQNFMCHKNFSIRFYPTPLQIVTGANGSGKSTIANAICLCLGVPARATGRTNNVQSFIQKGERFAQLTLILANEGPEAFKPEIYGREIQIVRRIGLRKSTYYLKDERGKVVSSRRDTIEEITQAFSIAAENPLCILHQDIAKTFLINSDSKKKYQFYMKVSQLDQIKQAYEQGLNTVQLLNQRIEMMKQKHNKMIRAIKPMEEKVKMIELRREQTLKKQTLEYELSLSLADREKKRWNHLQSTLENGTAMKSEAEENLKSIETRLALLNQEINEIEMQSNELKDDTNGPNGLGSLELYLNNLKREIQKNLDQKTRQCNECRQSITEIEFEQIEIEKQLREHEILKTTEENLQQRRISSEEEMKIADEKRKMLKDRIEFLNEDLKKIDEDTASLELVRPTLKEKLDEFMKIEENQRTTYGYWMNDFLKEMENDDRFHKKPIGPIGRYVECIDPRWFYAVEKHFESLMNAFICHDKDDERILIEIFRRHTPDESRPAVIVRTFAERTHDISGTLAEIRKANLLSMFEVLKIENVSVECFLIDAKHIDATILIEDLQKAKEISSSSVLRWNAISQKVRQVQEAWTLDGSNVKFGSVLRFYTNEKRPTRYFFPNRISAEQLPHQIDEFRQRIRNNAEQIHRNSIERRRKLDELQQLERALAENQQKIDEIHKELEKIDSIEPPIVLNDSIDEFKEKLEQSRTIHAELVQKYNELNQKKEVFHGQIKEMVNVQQDVMKRLDSKMHQHETMLMKLADKRSQTYELEQRRLALTNKISELKKEIQQIQRKLNRFSNKQMKKIPKSKSKNSVRSIREIQSELNAVNSFLQKNDDTNEERRQLIDEYRTKRNEARIYETNYERCCQQIEMLNEFILKRRDRFVVIADQQEYLLSHQFRTLMERHGFHDCDIIIDHNREELEIVTQQRQKKTALLSGGERSISTFCFLLALWGSIYQPFRILDEIDIYMDNERRNATFEILHENTSRHSSSQHIILTPQTVNVSSWNELQVPVFHMPKPKRSISS